MNELVGSIEKFFASIPLPALETWGVFAKLCGVILTVFAYAGLTFRAEEIWRPGVLKFSWDSKSLQSGVMTFVAIIISGYLGSFFVLVPGAQTFESIKDLCVIVSLLLFGYPVLFVVPIAYGLSDIVEGVPVEFLLDWWPGYLMNPACFWPAALLIGKRPDFRKGRTWVLYGLCFLLFMLIEPILWGNICERVFTPEISYRNITPALFFTTAISWILAPFVMLAIFPLAQRWGIFWAEIPGHAVEKVVGRSDYVWESGKGKSTIDFEREGTIPMRLLLLVPFICTILVIVITTAFFRTEIIENSSHKLAQRLHEEISVNIKEKLDDLYARTKGGTEADYVLAVNNLLQNQSIARYGHAVIVGRDQKLIGSSNNGNQAIQLALRNFQRNYGMVDLLSPIHYRFDIISEDPIKRETWLVQASPYELTRERLDKWILLTMMPESYYLAGVRKGHRNSGVVMAVGLLFATIIAGILATLVSAPLCRLAEGTKKITEGDFSQKFAPSRLEELNSLSMALNEMCQTLKTSLSELSFSKYKLNVATRTARLGIWEWIIASRTLIWDELMFELHGQDKKKFKPTMENWPSILAPGEFQRLMSGLREVLDNNKEFETDYWIIRPDGTRRLHHGIAKLLPDSSGRPLRMIGISFDITEQRQHEEDLRLYRDHLEELVKKRTDQVVAREKLAALGFMSAGLAHEIKNPLNLIVNSSEIVNLQLEKLGPYRIELSEKVQDILGKIKDANKIVLSNGQRMDNVVKTLLMQIKRADSVGEEHVNVENSLRNSLEFVLSVYRAQMNNRIKVTLENDDSSAAIFANPVDFGRVFINIFDNSCYALLQKINEDPYFLGYLHISLSQDKDYLNISVRDNGIGISEESMRQIFNPFYTTKPPGKGTGLGLIFVNEVVRQYEGDINVKSEAGAYTELIVRFPTKRTHL